ncbi:hypothetical protein HRED_09412 [Candidatus Haloredivivus sp. G17]|nr:hypothetical protein HRED_09412 [Candidatus Haloredivivus sp. G17]
MELKIREEKLEVELADNIYTRAKGLAFRKEGRS